MGATIKEIMELADVQRMLAETGAESTYRHCHNACTWLILQIKRADLMDYNVCLCNGTFWGKDHSWLMVECPETEDHIVIDMTVDQFVDIAVPYAGPMTDDYEILRSAPLYDMQALQELVESLG